MPHEEEIDAMSEGEVPQSPVNGTACAEAIHSANPPNESAKIVETDEPVEEPGSPEYDDLHVWYHGTFNAFADRLFTDGTTIDYPTLLQIFATMHRASPLGSTMRELLDDHLNELCSPLLCTLFGHGD
jgi:hypothetical protein